MEKSPSLLDFQLTVERGKSHIVFVVYLLINLLFFLFCMLQKLEEFPLVELEDWLGEEWAEEQQVEP